MKKKIELNEREIRQAIVRLVGEEGGGSFDPESIRFNVIKGQRDSETINAEIVSDITIPTHD